MSMMSRLLLALSAIALQPVAAATLQIRTYPAGTLHVHALDNQHGVKSVLLQNLSVVNSGEGAATLERVTFELLGTAGVVQTQTLEAAELGRAAQTGRKLWDMGMLQALEFQFSPATLFGSGVVPAADTTLDAQQALLLTYRPFVFKGEVNRLRVTAQAREPGGALTRGETTLALSERVAKGYRFPLKGVWTVGAAASFHTAHRWNVAEEFALDVIQVGSDGRSFRGKGSRLRDYLAYAAPVYAARAGKVVRVVTDVPENVDMLRRPDEDKATYMQRIIANQSAMIAGGTAVIPGSHVVIDHGDGEFSMYVHLIPGPSPVRVGDTVSAGQVIGKLGHSGNSTEPHLHFQVCDGADPLHCAGIPVAFDGIELPLADDERAIQSGDLVIAR